MIDRRYLLVAAAVLPFAGCTNGQVDPQKVLDLLKGACGILVPLATIVEMLKLDPTLSASAIVNLICSGFKTAVAAQAAQGRLAATPGQTIEYDVIVNGKPVHVVATVQ
jgi:hypothetical protein